MSFHVLLPRPQSQFTDAEAAMDLGHKKCLWFFHGVGDDAETVLWRTDMAGLCDEHDLVVILPSVENSFCLDLNKSMRYRSYVAEELLPYTEKIFGLSPRREDRIIGGISMGGYGAASIGLDRPDSFSRIFCLSGALDLKAAARFSHACGIELSEELAAWRGLDARPAWNLLGHLEQAAQAPEKQELYLVCSDLDMVYKANVAFVERARELGFAPEFHTAPGLHEWSFWARHLPEAVAWAVR